MIFQIAFLLTFLSSVSAKCDNACSGHGTCDIHSKCTCYDNWGLGLSHDTGDCSQRICPYDFAWVDRPDKIGERHHYAECSAKGICNRDSGDCECFPGFEGKACQRASCPNDCSGHGQCAYLEDLPYKEVAADYVVGTFHDSPYTIGYRGWDVSKSRACICDPQYGDIDCSKRMCPYGTDVMDVRNNQLAAAKYQVQTITFEANNNAESIVLGPNTVNNAHLAGRSFALIFKSRLNETFVTRPIVYEAAAADLHDFVINVQQALEELPNYVIDKVEVHASQTFDSALTLNITFVGDAVQGPQNLLSVRSYLCGEGCSPRLLGVDYLPRSQNVTELQLSDFNSFECGRRGKCDYTTGICGCFAGYTGINCNTITALV